jgi:8-oxo-dGTP pyrophosphatase MutT (NUDIX family)
LDKISSVSPALDLELTAQGKHRRPQDFLLPTPEVSGETGDLGADQGALIPAAVLFPLVPRPEGIQVLLTRRTGHLRDHPGQISFPGGRMEPEDASPCHAALRETFEEIGLAVDLPFPLGYLPAYRTVTNFLVHPVVARVTPPFTLRLDSFEVAEAFEVPLDFLMNPANHREERQMYKGVWHAYHVIQYGDYTIWGATAGIILSFYQRLMIP